jgi:hypothetical protein
LDDYLRAHAAFIAQNYADIQTLTAHAAMPTGAIILWSGAVASIPTGWALCDGTSGTPDLRNRFVYGAGGSGYLTPGATGGASSAISSGDGSHNHSGATGAHQLTVAEMPSHAHAFTVTALNADSLGVGALTGGTANTAGDGSFSGTTAAQGGDQAHTHTLGTDGAHSHSVATIPPYMALCYLMKT